MGTCRPSGPGGTAFLDLERAASSRLQLGRPPSFRQRLGLAARVADIEAAGDTDQDEVGALVCCAVLSRDRHGYMCWGSPCMQDVVLGEDWAAPKPPELVAMLEEAVRR